MIYGNIIQYYIDVVNLWMNPYYIIVLCQLKIESLWLYTKHKRVLENIPDIEKYNAMLYIMSIHIFSIQKIMSHD